MILGSPSAHWVCAFEEIDTYIINLVSTLWPKCLQVVGIESDEDDITAELVLLMHNSPEFRDSPFHVRGQTELYTKRNGETRIKGRQDIEFFIGPKALVYECKRVRPKKVVRRTSTTLVDKYVTEGLNRFLTGQYAERDIFGGMLAYVIDGESMLIKKQLIGCIGDHALHPGSIAALPSLGVISRFASSHSRQQPCPAIKIHHALLPMLWEHLL